MESFLPDSVKAILAALIAIVFVLSRLARWLPDVSWLQVFRLPVLPMSEEQKERRRRRGNRLAGMEMVLAGFILPLLYLASTVMTFSEPGILPLVIVGACSLLCIGIGIWVFARNW